MKQQSHIVRILFINWHTKLIMPQFCKWCYISLYVWLRETRVLSRAAALGVVIVILWVKLIYFYTEPTSGCMSFSAGYLLVRARKSLTRYTAGYASCVRRGPIIGSAGLNSVEKLQFR